MESSRSIITIEEEDGCWRRKKVFHRYDYTSSSSCAEDCNDGLDECKGRLYVDGNDYYDDDEGLDNTTISTLQLDHPDDFGGQSRVVSDDEEEVGESDDEQDQTQGTTTTRAVKQTSFPPSCDPRKQIGGGNRRNSSSSSKIRSPPTTNHTSPPRDHHYHHCSNTNKAQDYDLVAVESSTTLRRKSTGRRGGSTAATATMLRDVCIQVGGGGGDTSRGGGEVFWQSSAILQIASPALVQHLTPLPQNQLNTMEEHDKAFLLDIPHRSCTEWRLLEPFLQPHSQQAAALTPGHLCYILKWIVELDLQVMLQQADHMMANILQAALSKSLSLSSSFLPERNNAGNDNNFTMTNTSTANYNTNSTTTTVTLPELLTWSYVAHAAKLPKTSRQVCLAWNQAFLSPCTWSSLSPSILSNHNNLVLVNNEEGGSGASADNDFFLALLETLGDLLELLSEWPEMRSSIWLSLIRYLPTDLEVYSCDPEQFLRNPLLPYLLRQGLLQHHHQRQQRYSASLFHATDNCEGQRSTCSTENEHTPSSTSTGDVRGSRPTNADNDSSKNDTVLSSLQPSLWIPGASVASTPASAGDSAWQSLVQEYLTWLVPSAASTVFPENEPTLSRIGCHSPEEYINHHDDKYCIHPEAAAPASNDVPWSTSLLTLPTAAMEAALFAHSHADSPSRREWLEAVWQNLQGPPILQSPSAAAPVSPLEPDIDDENDTVSRTSSSYPRKSPYPSSCSRASPSSPIKRLQRPNSNDAMATMPLPTRSDSRKIKSAAVMTNNATQGARFNDETTPCRSNLRSSDMYRNPTTSHFRTIYASSSNDSCSSSTITTPTTASPSKSSSTSNTSRSSTALQAYPPRYDNNDVLYHQSGGESATMSGLVPSKTPKFYSCQNYISFAIRSS